MSSSKKQQRFSEAELDALDLWDVGENFDRKEVAETTTIVPDLKNEAEISTELATATTTLTVEEIEKMQKQAYDEALEQGNQAGYEKGFEEGAKKGYKEGFEKGMTEGAKKGYEDSQELLREQTVEFGNILESLSEPLEELDETIENELVNLSIGIAKQVIRREIKTDAGQIIAIIREAVKALPVAAQKLILHMHPEDATLVSKAFALDDISSPWEIVEDPLMSRGGCKVETEDSKIDATVENRLAVIVATILGGERRKDRAE
jgi:flagellar assembly protein FliH